MTEYKGVIAVWCSEDRIWKKLLWFDAAMTQYRGIIAVWCSDDRK